MKDRSNLHILCEAQVSKINVNAAESALSTANSVSFLHNGSEHTVKLAQSAGKVSGEVILAAGKLLVESTCRSDDDSPTI